jgi:hypothetical protein
LSPHAPGTQANLTLFDAFGSRVLELPFGLVGLVEARPRAAPPRTASSRF